MTLREDQIQRYSRQILLGAVGGTGQERLLARGARLVGRGQSITVAGAYLAAAGSPVAPPDGKVTAEQVGFLFGAKDLGRDAPGAWADAICGLNADAARSPLDGGIIAELPATFDGPAPWVALGGGASSDVAVLVMRTHAGCPSCFELTCEGRGAPPSGAIAVQLGALAATAFQRAVLGLGGEGVQAWELEASGALAVVSGLRCIRCSQP